MEEINIAAADGVVSLGLVAPLPAITSALEGRENVLAAAVVVGKPAMGRPESHAAGGRDAASGERAGKPPDPRSFVNPEAFYVLSSAGALLRFFRSVRASMSGVSARAAGRYAMKNFSLEPLALSEDSQEAPPPKISCHKPRGGGLVGSWRPILSGEERVGEWRYERANPLRTPDLLVRVPSGFASEQSGSAEGDSPEPPRKVEKTTLRLQSRHRRGLLDLKETFDLLDEDGDWVGAAVARLTLDDGSAGRNDAAGNGNAQEKESVAPSRRPPETVMDGSEVARRALLSLVYDGHMPREVAVFCATRLWLDFVRRTVFDPPDMGQRSKMLGSVGTGSATRKAGKGRAD